MQIASAYSQVMHFIWLTMHQKRLAAGLLPDPLWELTALPKPPNWIQGQKRETGKRREETEKLKVWKRKRKKKGKEREGKAAGGLRMQNR